MHRSSGKLATEIAGASPLIQRNKEMIVRTARIATCIVGIMALVGCEATFKATHDSDPGQDFSGYSTWTWINAHPMTVGATSNISNPLLESKIQKSIGVALAARGFTKLNAAESVDFVVAFTVGSREEIKVDSYPTMSPGYGYGYPGRWGGAYYGGYYGGTQTTVRQYTKGMLAIDIFDIKSHRPVWHGSASKSIHDSDRNNLDETIDGAVAAIMAGCPPR